MFSSLVIALIMGQEGGIFALIGAGICILPSAVFALFAFRYAGAQKNKQVVQSFRKGSVLKLLLTMVLFALVFKHTTALVFPLFIGYITAMVAQWPAILFVTRRTKTTN
ncbi:ATP synthase subunit I [Aestuariibacter sp. A3R04]|uniref:ATP synthase subunit I n=1 Tax=Aestuariibacter sp. A3R04 TaxID=2841571 RepID=UPI001C09F833|nr:ATP synthase subunit I [Aestuariibacter sp. A3R04]